MNIIRQRLREIFVIDSRSYVVPRRREMKKWLLSLLNLLLLPKLTLVSPVHYQNHKSHLVKTKLGSPEVIGPKGMVSGRDRK